MARLLMETKVLLFGNGPYLNRGCEAIVRGTLTILESAFGTGLRVIHACYSLPSVVQRQQQEETDGRIRHMTMVEGGDRRFTKTWLQGMLNHYIKTRFVLEKAALDFAIKEGCQFALSIGGDNYSVDGKSSVRVPKSLILAGEYLKAHSMPVFIWGASINPGTYLPRRMKWLYTHLRSVDGIFAREPFTEMFLKDIVPEVVRVCDPAFLLRPKQPDRIEVPAAVLREGIGLNLSGYVGSRLTTHGGPPQMIRLYAEIVRELIQKLRRPVILIPHVTTQESNDNEINRQIMGSVDQTCRAKVFCITDPHLNAAELKWIISHCAVFAGARTHATIAALSSAVPTLSFSYSGKARGINEDVYRSQEYCLEPSQMWPAVVAQKLDAMLSARAEITQRLKAMLPIMEQRAYAAGHQIKHLLHGDAKDQISSVGRKRQGHRQRIFSTEDP